MTNKTENSDNIKKIDKTVMEASKKNKLNDNMTKLVQQTIERKTGGNTDTNAKIYKETMARDSKMKTEVASVEYNRTLKLDKVKDTIRDVMIANRLDEKTVIQEHKNIKDLAKADKQYNVAEKCNSKFMDLLGMTAKKDDHKTKVSTYIDKIAIILKQ